MHYLYRQTWHVGEISRTMDKVPGSSRYLNNRGRIAKADSENIARAGTCPRSLVNIGLPTTTPAFLGIFTCSCFVLPSPGPPRVHLVQRIAPHSIQATPMVCGPHLSEKLWHRSQSKTTPSVKLKRFETVTVRIASFCGVRDSMVSRGCKLQI